MVPFAGYAPKANDGLAQSIQHFFKTFRLLPAGPQNHGDTGNIDIGNIGNIDS